MSDYKLIGKSVPRLDGYTKAVGDRMFFADLAPRCAWIGGAVRSSIAAGKIKKILKDPKFDWSKAVCITAADLPAVNYVAMIRPDYPILADKEIIFATQGIVLLAACDKKTLDEAKRAITVETEEAEPILDFENSTKNLDQYKIVRGDINAAFNKADLIVEGTYRTGYQEHAYLENHGMWAMPEGDNIILEGSMQCPYYVHNAVVQALNCPPEKVIVRQNATGGGFGGKEDYPSVLGVWTALLAKKAGKPVKFSYDREEDMLCTTKRHPSKTYHKTALKRDGTITGMEIDIILDGGAATTMSKVVLSRSILHATGCYNIENAKINARAVFTNTPPNGAFRGFGVPQSIFALERHIDQIAKVLNADPLELRIKNLMRNGHSFPYGQKMTSGVSAGLVLEDVIKRSDYRNKRVEFFEFNEKAKQKNSPKRRGIGLSLALHGGGFTGSGEDNMHTKVRVETDLSSSYIVTILASSTDMGQGAGTVLPMIAAEELGIPISQVEYPNPDTSKVPNSGPTVASRTTMYVGYVVREACKNMLARLYEAVPEAKGGAFFSGVEKYAKKHGKLFGEAVYTPVPGYTWDDETYQGTAYKGYSWLAQVVEAEVDLDTYEITPTKSTISVELGKAINPVLATGQIEGGSLQAYGWAGIEEMGLTSEGKYTTGKLSGYTIPTTLDSPRFDVALFEDPCEFGAFGAKGIGELPMDGGAPAFAAAVENATGAFAERIPITGEYLFSLLEEGKAER